MNFFVDALNWFAKNILQQPAFFVGLLVLIGYLLLKKPLHDVFAGFVKATVGYKILDVGAGGLVTTFKCTKIGCHENHLKRLNTLSSPLPFYILFNL